MACNGNSADCYFLGYFPWPCACFLGVGALMLGAFRASLPTGGDPYFITGFASASFIWFSCLAIVVHALGSTINSHVLTWLNRICGAVIVLYGGEIVEIWYIQMLLG
ncbi:MAG: LysE family transporter [Lachnospiraceae bacterium]